MKIKLLLSGLLVCLGACEVKQDLGHNQSPVTCQQSEVDCSGTCTTLADDSHCGSCDTSCAQGQHCGNGSCFSCAASAPNYCPYPNGGGSCSDLVTDNLNCGWCGHACDELAGQTCSNGTCTTTATGSCGQETNCNGVCTTLADDAHCGSCDKACPQGQHCGNGDCFSCAASAPYYCPYPNGGGSCTDFVTDNVNCGSCGHQCALGQTCKNGGCS